MKNIKRKRKNKYYYKIGFYSYEGNYYIELIHAKKFTKDDLTNMIIEMIIDFLKNREDKFIHSFEDIFINFDAKNWLIKNKGFKPIKYEQVWEIFGWSSIFYKDIWDYADDKKLEKIVKALNKAGYNKKDDDLHKYDKDN